MSVYTAEDLSKIMRDTTDKNRKQHQTITGVQPGCIIVAMDIQEGLKVTSGVKSISKKYSLGNYTSVPSNLAPFVSTHHDLMGSYLFSSYFESAVNFNPTNNDYRA